MKYLGTYDYHRMSARDKRSFLEGFEAGSGIEIDTNLWPLKFQREGTTKAVILDELEDRFGFAYAAGFGRGETQKLIDMPIAYRCLEYRKSASERLKTGPKPLQTVTLWGRTMSGRDWDRLKGLPLGTVNYRIKAGWSPERAINTPLKQPSKRKK